MKNLFLVTVFLYIVDCNAQFITNIDTFFKATLLQADITNDISGHFKIDSNNNGEIEFSEALLVDYIRITSLNLNSISGIEYFVNIRFVFLTDCNIATADFSNLPQLTFVYIKNNPLSSLILNGCTSLEKLSFGGGGSQINNFNFNGLPNLKAVQCSDNLFTTLDFSNNPFLEELGCANNNLNTIIIKNSKQHNFAQSNILFTDCWATGNPNLSIICADSNEIAPLQSFLTSCGTTQTINITTNCALANETFTKEKFVITPNPSNDVFTIHFGANIKNATLKLYNMLGQMVKQEFINDVEAYQINDLQKGLYSVKVTNRDFKYSTQIVKQ